LFNSGALETSIPSIQLLAQARCQHKFDAELRSDRELQNRDFDGQESETAEVADARAASTQARCRSSDVVGRRNNRGL